MTIQAFLAWEEREEPRWEFDGFKPVAMTGGTNAHEAIGDNLRALLHIALRGKRCRVRGPTMKIEVAGRIHYPDAFVFCSSAARDQTLITDPVVVFEVLSPSTSHIDRIEKLCEYRSTASIQRYVILEQDAIAATVYLKQDGTWIVSVLTEGDTLTTPEIHTDIPLAAIYADGELPSPDAVGA
jgi:Uma2 family endonuclease